MIAPILRIFDVRSPDCSSGKIGASKMSLPQQNQKISENRLRSQTLKIKIGADIKKTPEKSGAFFTPLCLHTDVFVWCARLDLNQHAERHMLLRHTCIPISPLAHVNLHRIADKCILTQKAETAKTLTKISKSGIIEGLS